MADIINIGTKQSGDELTAGEVNQIVTKTNAVIVELNQKVAAVTGKGLSTEDYTTLEKQKLSRLNEFNKGFFANEAAIIAAYPAGSAGWFVINGETDTVWLWDVEGNAWKNSGTQANIGSGGIIDVLYAEMATAIANSTLVPGQQYKITDRGDRGIILQAIGANKLASEGIRIMLCPATYRSRNVSGNNWLGVWNVSRVATVNSLTIWNGQVWKCIAAITGGTAPDLNTTNWQLVPKTSFSNGEYIEMTFGCMYDFTNNWIAKQWDRNGNIFGINYATEYDSNYGLGYGFNLCDYSDWNFATSGNRFDNNVCQGVYNNSNNGDIYGNINNGRIYDNSNNGSIRNNTNNGDINSNSNAGSIVNNSNIGGIYSNSNTDNISSNLNNGDIGNNNSHVMSIYNNVNTGGINSNTNTGQIMYNYNTGEISSNSNTGNISNNSSKGDISGNSNSDVIELNANLGGITNNSNGGGIINNSNCGSIFSNTITGEIFSNRNNGLISCTGTGYISRNVNNGSISGAKSGNVTDTQTNK